MGRALLVLCPQHALPRCCAGAALFVYLASLPGLVVPVVKQLKHLIAQGRPPSSRAISFLIFRGITGQTLDTLLYAPWGDADPGALPSTAQCASASSSPSVLSFAERVQVHPHLLSSYSPLVPEAPSHPPVPSLMSCYASLSPLRVEARPQCIHARTCPCLALVPSSSIAATLPLKLVCVGRGTMDDIALSRAGAWSAYESSRRGRQ